MALTLRSCSTAATQPSHSLVCVCDCSCRVIPWHRPGGGYTAVTQLWTSRAPSSRPPGSLTRGAPFPRPHTRSSAAASPRHAPRPLPQPQTLLKEGRGGTRAKERVAEREQKRQRAALDASPSHAAGAADDGCSLNSCLSLHFTWGASDERRTAQRVSPPKASGRARRTASLRHRAGCCCCQRGVGGNGERGMKTYVPTPLPVGVWFLF